MTVPQLLVQIPELSTRPELAQFLAESDAVRNGHGLASSFRRNLLNLTNEMNNLSFIMDRKIAARHMFYAYVEWRRVMIAKRSGLEQGGKLPDLATRRMLDQAFSCGKNIFKNFTARAGTPMRDRCYTAHDARLDASRPS